MEFVKHRILNDEIRKHQSVDKILSIALLVTEGVVDILQFVFISYVCTLLEITIVH